jgi:hypothetical protein
MSHSNAEHREYLQRELMNVGLKPEFITTSGGHMRVRWTHSGKQRSILTAQTPSDHRATLNARSRIRKILREDGVFQQQRERATPLKMALSIPVGRDPNCVRIERLEQDISTLLDMVAELVTKLGVKMDDEATLTAAAPAPAPEEKKKRKGGMKSKRHDLLLCLEYQPLPLDTIVRRSGRTYTAVSVALNNLKTDGLADNPQRGMWRKKQILNGVNGTNGVAHAMNGHHA